MPQKVSSDHLVSLLLLSGGGLFLEITLTRLFAAIYFPPYVFAILALAILGIGLGAAAATWRRELRLDAYLPHFIALVGLSALVLVIVVVLTAAVDLQALLFILVALPYFFVGLALVTIFSDRAESSPRLYMADLLGAGLGAVLAIPLLNMLGPIDSIFVVVVIFGLAALIVHAKPMPLLQLVVVVLGLAALSANLSLDWLSLEMASLHTDKPITESLQSDGEVIQTEWESFARTDLVRPGDGGPYRVYIDGAAGSIMPPALENSFLLRDIGFFPFATAQPNRVMVIGPGGGLDVWFGLRSGASEIIAVEVNPASVELVRDYSGYNGSLYNDPAVEVIVDEGRSVLRRMDTEFDLIFLSQVVTLAAERSGYALTENTIYTVQAFQDYLRHLTPEGQIAVKLYDEITLTRALSTALAALRERGLSDAEALQHTAAFLDPEGDPSVPLLLVRNQPFTEDDALAHGAVAREVGFVPLYLPAVLAEAPLDEIEAGTRTFGEIVEQSAQDISPPTDDRPFFYQFERGIPQNLQPLLSALLGILVVGGLLMAFLQRRVKPAALRLMPVYFAGLGAGFIMIEIAVIQQTRLFLGHPTLAVTTVLAVLLIGSGIGSWLAGRWIAPRYTSLPAWPSIAVSSVLVIWVVIWPLISKQFLAAQLLARILVVILSLTPLALLMGMPFPLGLRSVGRAGSDHVALAWTVNGVTTVVGTVVAITLAITIGFTGVLVGGVLTYTLAGVISLSARGPLGRLGERVS